MGIIKISLLGISGVMLGVVLKSSKPEYAGLLTLAVGILILGMAARKMQYLFETLDRIRQMLPIESQYISALVKMLGITFIGQFSAGICTDAGCKTTGEQIEMFCRLSLMVLSMPVLTALLETLQGYLS